MVLALMHGDGQSNQHTAHPSRGMCEKDQGSQETHIHSSSAPREERWSCVCVCVWSGVSPQISMKSGRLPGRRECPGNREAEGHPKESLG